MCDTMVALGNSTADGSVLFAKNSDREPNEAQQLMQIAAAEHEAGSSVQCTYVSIPQAAHTHAVLLSKPFWMWGAEMGANEHGVVIGNEAVFSKIPAGKEPGLIGMDFLRLGLERGCTARHALDVITGLLARHGQSGNCGFTHPFYYHNSFIIADPQDAWVLETVDRQWAAVQVKSIRTISNGYTIRREWDLASAGLVDFAVEMGLCKQRGDFDFAMCYSDLLYTTMSDQRKRQACTTSGLLQAQGNITPRSMIDLLGSHHGNGANGWSPDRALSGADVCMHAGFGPVRGSQTAGSMVSQLTPAAHTHWLTGTAAPCTGVFKPVWMDAGLPETAVPAGEFDPESLYWRHERLHRAVLKDYSRRIRAYASERQELQDNFLAGAGRLQNAPAAQRRDFSEQCFRQAGHALESWLEKVMAVPCKPQAFYYRSAWSGWNRQSKMPAD